MLFLVNLYKKLKANILIFRTQKGFLLYKLLSVSSQPTNVHIESQLGLALPFFCTSFLLPATYALFKQVLTFCLNMDFVEQPAVKFRAEDAFLRLEIAHFLRTLRSMNVEHSRCLGICTLQSLRSLFADLLKRSEFYFTEYQFWWSPMPSIQQKRATFVTGMLCGWCTSSFSGFFQLGKRRAKTIKNI